MLRQSLEVLTDPHAPQKIMSKKHKVIIVPGLGDETSAIRLFTNHWRSHGLEPVIHSVGWHDDKNNFKSKLQNIVKLIDKFSKEGSTVSLLGVSAGGSAVLNAFIEQKDRIHRVVNICGRLRAGTQKGFRSFEARTSSSPAFAQSIILCESSESKLSKSDRSKVMTVRAMFGDELVPSDTAVLKGAYNTRIPTPEHIFSIGMALTILSKPIILFIQSQ